MKKTNREKIEEMKKESKKGKSSGKYLFLELEKKSLTTSEDKGGSKNERDKKRDQ